MTTKVATDALSVLTEDHEAIRRQFEHYRQTHAGRRELALAVCQALAVHAALEEALFYPQAHDALEDDHVIASAVGDHQRMHALIVQVEAADTTDEQRDAAMAQLQVLAVAHMREEEGGLFVRLQYTSLDLEALGRQMLARRGELLGR